MQQLPHVQQIAYEAAYSKQIAAASRRAASLNSKYGTPTKQAKLGDLSQSINSSWDSIFDSTTTTSATTSASEGLSLSQGFAKRQAYRAAHVKPDRNVPLLAAIFRGFFRAIASILLFVLHYIVLPVFRYIVVPVGIAFLLWLAFNSLARYIWRLKQAESRSAQHRDAPQVPDPPPRTRRTVRSEPQPPRHQSERRRSQSRHHFVYTYTVPVLEHETLRGRLFIAIEEMRNQYRHANHVIRHNAWIVFLLLPTLFFLKGCWYSQRHNIFPVVLSEGLSVPWYLQIPRNEEGSNHLGNLTPQAVAPGSILAPPPSVITAYKEIVSTTVTTTEIATITETATSERLEYITISLPEHTVTSTTTEVVSAEVLDEKTYTTTETIRAGESSGVLTPVTYTETTTIFELPEGQTTPKKDIVRMGGGWCERCSQSHCCEVY